jgi:hypothetical protein
MDWSEFDRVFERMIRRTAPQLAARGLRIAFAYAVGDAVQDEPRTPHKTGALWRSQRIDDPVITEDSIFVVGGFDIEYAAAMHEAPPGLNYTLPGSGPKFLEAKLVKNGEKYMKIAADHIRGNWTTA